MAKETSIYPLNIPAIEVNEDLDFLLLELPPRFKPLLPHGLGYVNNILKSTGISFQTLDVNIICYHRYHSKRLLVGNNPVILSNSIKMREEPWDESDTSEWHKEEVVDYFWPHLEEVIQEIIKKRPKSVGISSNCNNRFIAFKFINAIRESVPEILFIAGGYDCIHNENSKHLLHFYDYVVIGEAEMTLPFLVTALAQNEKPKDVPGVISRFDTPGRAAAIPLPPHDLDLYGFPQYEWLDTELYRNFTGERHAVISSSRGCNWRRCRYCNDKLIFRKRSPAKVAAEIEFWVKKGFRLIQFNDSDINGDYTALYELCSEIIKRKLNVKLLGQQRVDKHNTREFFQHLAKAGFFHLSFGVDGWSDHILRLQGKGYNMKQVFQNLRDCYESGIHVIASAVVGVPGETDDDVAETIANFIKCKNYITLIGTLRPLELLPGSIYFQNQAKYKISFLGDKEQIIRDYPINIPNDLWFSEEPYIDKKIRFERVDHITRVLLENGLPFSHFLKSNF
ncbi:B12-binding domain-containing radical SAM protein [candidate division CSSED10-310 bacterium]|uniref:B12-binding domain-containing radical SAM protein n=1 Tax=candidate division CSSED10-310 bacterium TaxID=2855610 RepID=A0ABV6YVQ0_UNCC1